MEHLKEAIEKAGIPITAIAQQLGVTTPSIYKALKGEPIKHMRVKTALEKFIKDQGL